MEETLEKCVLEEAVEDFVAQVEEGGFEETEIFGVVAVLGLKEADELSHEVGFVQEEDWECAAHWSQG